MSDKEEKIQIVAFSTNESNQTPNDILQILLDQYTHTIIKKSRHAIALTLVLPDSINSTKIMMCSVLNLTREYTGITDVNCYFIFIDLQNENSKENFDLIISYFKDYCDLTKKIFIIGFINKDNNTKHIISKEEVKRVMDSGNLNYEYFELNLNKTKEVSDSLLNIFVKSSKEENGDEFKVDKNEKQAHSCNVY